MTTLKWLLLIVVVGYGGVLGLMYVFQRALMYFPDPTRTPPAAAGLPQAEEVTLTSGDGEKLVAWYVPPKGKSPVIIYFHGNAGALDLRAGRFKWLIADGTGLLALSYRGYGGSTGKPSETGLISDGMAAYDFAAARYPTESIVLWGKSLGTAVAVAVAAERKVGRSHSRCPLYLHCRCRSRRLSVRAGALADQGPVPLRRAHCAGRAPLLVLHGARDRIVPIALGEKLFSLAREPKRFVRFPLGGHVDLDDYGAQKAVRMFLSELG